MTLSVSLEAVALIGPGLPDWDAARAVLAGVRPYVPAPTDVPAPLLLPPNERRRSGVAVRIALAVGAAARSAEGIATVFASSAGDVDTCHAICQQLAGEDRLISPTRFHNSVHNAPAGYWSIATRDMHASTSVCAYDGSFAAGLLEAGALVRAGGAPVLLIAYDAPYPVPLLAKRPVAEAFGLALRLAPASRDGALAMLTIESTDARPDAMDAPALESMRRAIPTARALPLLGRLARREAGTAVIDYLEGFALAVAVAPCG
ncbi:MAG: beta-ketoacyl synthase chain length factor [Burkholderiales bacterium]